MVRPDRITDLTFNANSLWLVIKHAAQSHVFEFEAGASRAVTVGAAEHANLQLRTADAPPIACYFEREGDDVWLVPGYRSEQLRFDTTVVDKRRRVWGRGVLELPGVSLEVRVREEPPTCPQLISAKEQVHTALQVRAHDVTVRRQLKEQDLMCGGLAADDLGGENLTIRLAQLASSRPPAEHRFSETLTGPNTPVGVTQLRPSDDTSARGSERTDPFGVSLRPPTESHLDGKRRTAPLGTTIDLEPALAQLGSTERRSDTGVSEPMRGAQLRPNVEERLPSHEVISSWSAVAARNSDTRARNLVDDQASENPDSSGGSVPAVVKPSVHPLASLGELTKARPLLVALGASAGSAVLILLMLVVTKFVPRWSEPPRGKTVTLSVPKETASPVVAAKAAVSCHETVVLPSPPVASATSQPVVSVVPIGSVPKRIPPSGAPSKSTAQAKGTAGAFSAAPTKTPAVPPPTQSGDAW